MNNERGISNRDNAESSDKNCSLAHKESLEESLKKLIGWNSAPSSTFDSFMNNLSNNGGLGLYDDGHVVMGREN